MDRERRRSTSDDRNSIASDIDFRSATEAMQRAADAMIAATESFRKQFHQQDSSTSPETSPPRRRIDHSASYSESSSSGANNARGRADRNDKNNSRPPRASSTRRRPASHQPYRPASANSMHPAPYPGPFNTQSAHAATPSHRPSSATGSLHSLPGTSGPATQYYMYRATTRPSTGLPAPPVALHMQMHAHKLPISHFSTSRPVTADATTSRQAKSDRLARERFADKFPVVQVVDSGDNEKGGRPMLTEKARLAEKDRLEKEKSTRDDAGIAMVMSVSNPRRLLPSDVQAPGPLAMHPVQLPLQQSSQQPSQQPSQQDAEKPVPSSRAPSNSVTARTSPANWSLMPRIPKSPETAAPIPSSCRLTTPDSVAYGGASETRDTKDAKDVRDFKDGKEKGQNNNPFTSAPVGARVSSVSGRRPSMSSYIDLIEAASRLKRTPSYQGISHAGGSTPRDTSFTPGIQGGGHVTDDDRGEGEGEVMVSQMAPRYADIDDDGTLHHQLVEPEPVLQIGRYTYVRSGDASHDLEYRASLIRDMHNLYNMQTMQTMQLHDAPRYSSYHGPGGHGTDNYGRNSLGAPASYRQSLPPQKPPKQHSGPHGFSLPHEILFVLVVCLAQVLMLAGIAQALVPSKIMGQSFPDTNPGNLAWYTASYGLTAGTFVLPAGRLGDLFGHRKIFILGFLWLAVWSLIAGFAPMVQRSGAGSSLHRGTVFFIVARTMQGVGTAMLVPNGQAMLGRAYAPGPRKNIVMSLLGASAPLGFVVGAVMSSLFAIYASWPWAFWTMAAACVALAAVSILVLPADATRRSQSPPSLPTTDDFDLPDDVDDDEYDDDDVVVSKKKLARLKALAAKRAAAAAAAAANRESLWVRMDGMGIILGVAGLALINFAFNQAPIVGWRTPYTYFLLIIGVLSLAAFLYVEAYQAKHPLVPLSAMRSTTNFVLGCTAAGWGCFSVWVYYAVQVFEHLRGWSPLRTSAAFAPAPVTGLMASLLTGLLLSRGVKPHWVMLVSMLAFFIGSLLFATSSPAQSQLYWFNPFFSILIMPFGMDMSNPAATILLSNSVTREHQGIAASLVVTVVNYAISLALGVAGSVESAAYDPNDLLAGYRAAQYFGLGLGGLGILFGTAFLCQSYLRTPPSSGEKKV